MKLRGQPVDGLLVWNGMVARLRRRDRPARAARDLGPDRPAAKRQRPRGILGPWDRSGESRS
jgi:hypothetical protein